MWVNASQRQKNAAMASAPGSTSDQRNIVKRHAPRQELKAYKNSCTRVEDGLSSKSLTGEQNG